MSCAPRPQSSPSAISPDHGSRCQSAGSASTVSTCDSRHEPRPVGLAAQARDEVRALLGAAEQVDLEAGVAQDAGEVLLALALVARRVHRVEPDEALEQLRGVLLEIGHDPAGYASAGAVGGFHRTGGHTQRGDGPALRHRRAPAGTHRRPARAGPARGAHAPAHARRGRRPGARARARAAPCARAIEQGRPHSMVLYGPPGSGKTTIARIVATAAHAAFEELSAVEAGRPEVRKVLERADHRRQGTGEPTIFFLDEIHRFNKAQQDALLPGRRGGPRDPHRGDDREPVLRGQLGAALADAGLRAARALGRRRRGAAAPRARPRRVRRARGARRRRRVPRGARGRRRADGPGGARAGVRDRARRRAHHARARRGRPAAPRAHLRQAGRPPLRHDLGLDQGDARLGPRRVAVLPRGDDRGAARTRASSPGGWSSSPPRTSATPTRRRCRSRSPRRTPSSTWACPRRPTRSPSARSTSSLAPKSNAAGRALGAARALVQRARRAAAPALPAERGLPGRGEARARGRATTTRTTTRRRSATRSSCPTPSSGTRFYDPGRDRGGAARAARGDPPRARALSPATPPGPRRPAQCQRDAARAAGPPARAYGPRPIGGAHRRGAAPHVGRRAWARTSGSHGPRS